MWAPASPREGPHVRHYPGRMSTARTLVRRLGGALRAAAVRRQDRSAPGRALDGSASRGGAQARSDGATPPDTRPHGTAPSYPGDFTGALVPVYSPDPDGEPDPGEIVWTWVPYEEDHSRGKDRPVLIVGHDDAWLLGLMLTTRDHDTDRGPRDEQWVDIGSGPWDVERRPSEVRVDRVIRIWPAAVRREGAVLDRRRFDQVAGSLQASRG